MYILADIGGTKMRIAGTRDLKSFTEPVILNTPQTYEEFFPLFVEAAKTISNGEPIEALAGGVPIVLSRDKRVFLKETNLPGWGERAFADEIESVLKTKVYLENDTALVGLGEAVFGAGKGREIVVYVTVSTGVNGARIVNGIIDPSMQGFEIGYQYVSTDATPQKWGDLISGRKISEKYGKSPKDLGKDWEGWEELARLTAIGVHNSILHWSPDRVVLGGSMFNEVGISIERVSFHTNSIMKIFPTVPEIVHSSLGDFGGLWGGLALLNQPS